MSQCSRAYERLQSLLHRRRQWKLQARGRKKSTRRGVPAPSFQLEPFEPRVFLSITPGDLIDPNLAAVVSVPQSAYVFDAVSTIQKRSRNTSTPQQFLAGPGSTSQQSQTIQRDAGTVVGSTTGVAEAPGVPPKVTGVWLSSTDWSTPLINQLDPVNGLGVGVPAGSGDQLLPFGQNDIDQVVLRFSEEVVIGAEDLTIRGANVPEYSVTGFHYDPSTFTATWTLVAPFGADKLLLDLSPMVRDIQGDALDGEWDNPTNTSDLTSSVFNSGDGVAGGFFEFRINILPGDATQDGTVNGDDLLVWQASLFDTGANLAADFNQDETVNGDDLLIWQASLFDALSGGDPDRPIIVGGLFNDTAPGGLTNTDRVTADPTVLGRMGVDPAVNRLLLGLDGAA